MQLTKTEIKYKNLTSNPNHVWTEQEIISFRSFINSKNRQRLEINKMLLNVFHNSCEVSGGLKITTEQAEKGISWLRRTQLNKKGELRSAKSTFIGFREKHVIDNFSHFVMVGLRDIGCSPYSNYTQYVPVYKCVSSEGESFEYSASQSGCEVVG